MVDALHQTHRVLRAGGLLIDARPDSRRPARVEHHERGRLRPVGTVNTAAESRIDDRLSDRAIARVKREGIFRSRRQGGFIHRVTFPDRAGLQAFLDDSVRIVKRVRWSADAPTRRRWEHDTFSIQRPVRYELLEKISPRR